MSNFKKYVAISLMVFFGMIFSSNALAFFAEYQNDAEIEPQENTFSVGQVWSYETRQNEITSRLTVLKIDHFEKAVVVHIRLDNVKVMDPKAPQGIRTTVTHMAFMQSALEESVNKILKKKGRLPEFSKEYQSWRDGDGVGTAWAWLFSVSKALNGLERLISNKQQSSSTLKTDENLNSNN